MVTNNTKNRVWGCLDWFHDLRYFLCLVLTTYNTVGLAVSNNGDDCFKLIFGLVFAGLPCLPWILLYGYVIIPNEPYVKFCKDGRYPVGVAFGKTRAFLSNETETWECPPKPGSTLVKQFIRKDWQCNETYCTTDELASPESCHDATGGYFYPQDGWSPSVNLRDCDNWSADYPRCCVNADYDGTYVACEYCIPDKEILWAISTFAGIATTIPFLCLAAFCVADIERLTYEREQRLRQRVARKFEAKAKKEAEEKAKKDAEAAEQGV